MTPQESAYNDLLTEIGQLTIVTMLLPVAVALVRYRQLNQPTRVFLGYLIATIGVNLIEQAFIWSVNTYTSFWLPYLTRWQIGDTHFLQILAYLKNFLLLGWYFGLVVPARLGRGVVGVSLALSLLALIDYLWMTGYNVPGVLTPTLNGVFTTSLPMIHLWFLVRQDQKVSLYRIPYFWFSAGLILSYLFQLLFFFLGEKIYQTDFLLYVKLSIAGNFLRVLSQVLFAYGFSQWKLLRYL
jgi:hypothetical protein